ncbi:EscU/YscU/HrcU family type III secretion system export apparatus switch protein [Aquicella lusitana]|uniref:Flagellar biosynthetic protein FlhB n=1 Tax=Aquicella lusitana TaxID=254246 RepID=A0A370G652_9COXI|nr:flagellar type III secretion system protein FlhB [Aquicella lusitana]RDI38536.1 flagellar biosynthetic protein FlhB [Aquicella lusitana]VVC74619.1 Flagellar biosynthetic protein FlhB [Aquicella lusitana]
MSHEAQEKQHQPTSKHISDLRKQGIVMRSRDLSGGLVFTVTVAMLIIMSAQLMMSIKKNFSLAFSSIPDVIHNANYLGAILKKIALANFYQLLPIFIIMLVVAILSPFLFGGWNFTLDAIQFKLSKLNPTNNLGKLFSYKNALIEIARSIVKASIFLCILTFFLISNLNDIISLMNLQVISAITASEYLIKYFILFLCIALIFTVIFDIAYHYFRYQQQAKMSLQEVKDEQKDTEGSVESKRKMRLKQLAMVKQRINYSVPKASVVITNPTHYAVALKYNSGKDKAPKVIAKGKGIIAYQIRKAAISHGISIYQAPDLARAIYFTTKLGSEIHPGLYKPVAIVLSYVYQLKNYQYGVGKHPEIIEDLSIPKEFIYHE